LLEFLRKNKVVYVYIPLAVYWIIIFTLTTLPGKDIPNIGISDKIEHATAYCFLAILVNLTFIIQDKYSILKLRSYLYTLILIAIYAALDELHQLFIPTRDCDIKDWIADVIGASIALTFSYFMLKKIKAKSQKIA
jgi:VanZ family protein